jgi:phosphoesterase RecJ-like protein
MFTPIPVPAGLLNFIKGGDKFIVTGHKEPDGDCVGSQLALVSVLRRLGKEAIPCSPGPFKRTEIKPFEGRFIGRPGEGEKDGARLIVVDCTGIDRTGDLEKDFAGIPTAIIDHHASARQGDKNGDAVSDGPVYRDIDAPSVTFMIRELIEALGLEPTAEEAELLFFGLCTDTGYFRHVDQGGAETFTCASRLIQAGASPKAAFNAINGGKSFASRLLLGRILTRAESHFGGKLILSTEPLEDTQAFGLEGRDSDTLYQLLQSVGGVEAIVIIRQETADNCTVGFRSRDRVDVSAVAAQFGGGGHKNAAGASIPGHIADLAPKILRAFEKLF